MSSVHIVMSVYNGYKNVEEVFATKEDAMAFMEKMASDWHYENHTLYVCEYNVW